MSITGAGTVYFCDHFKHSVDRAFRSPCKVAEEDGCCESVKKTTLAVSTVFLVGFLWHLGSAAFYTYKFRRVTKVLIHDAEVYKRMRRIDVKRNPKLIGGKMGCYGVRESSDGSILSTVIKDLPSSIAITVSIKAEQNKTIRIANRGDGVCCGAPICSDIYNRIVFRDFAQAAAFIAFQPVIWEVVPFEFRECAPKPVLAIAKPGDLFIIWPKTADHPKGQLIRKIADGARGQPIVENLAISRLRLEHQQNPTIVMQTFLAIWDEKMSGV